MLRRLLTGLGRLELPALPEMPAQCTVCHAWPARPVCAACLERFAPPCERCLGCALPVVPGLTRCGACVLRPPPLDACHAAVNYAWPWSELIARWNFHQTPGWARPLSALLLHTPGVTLALAEAELLIPMPLSAERLRARGFNQALGLARCLDPHKVQAQLLLRVRDTTAQNLLTRAERQRNVRDAFAVEPLRSGELPGRRIMLVDDVMTSGASLHAAARTLRAAGAQHITAVVVARTPEGSQDD